VPAGSLSAGLPPFARGLGTGIAAVRRLVDGFAGALPPSARAAVQGSPSSLTVICTPHCKRT
jgi:hypothetical protein